MTRDTSVSGGTKRKMTREERLAQQRSAHEEALVAFEKDRKAIWLRILCSAQRLALAFSIHPEFAEELNWNTRNGQPLRVDIEANSVTYSGLGTATEEQLTYEQSVNLIDALEGLEERFKCFVAMQRKNEEIQAMLDKLHQDALAKLTDAEKVTLDVFRTRFGQPLRGKRKQAECAAEERAVIEKEILRAGPAWRSRNSA